MRPLAHTTVAAVDKRQLLRPLVLSLLGAGLGVAAYVADQLVQTPLAPVSAEGARQFLSSVIASGITVTALLFWIRGMLVQLSAGQLSSRVLRWYLEDHFLVQSISFLLGVVAYASVTVMILPADGEQPAPLIATVLAGVLTLAALLTIVLAITDSVRATDIGAILGSLAQDTTNAIRRHHANADQATCQHEALDHDEAHALVQVQVASDQPGWLVAVDHEQLLERMPDHTDVRVPLHAGAFVGFGQELATVWTLADADTAERLADDLPACFTVSSRRRMGQDVEFGIRKLVDVAVQALSPGTSDYTSAFEALRYLGVVFGELLTRPLPPRCLEAAGQRQLHVDAAIDYGDFLDRAFGELREAAGMNPRFTAAMLEELGRLRGLVLADRDDRIDAIDQQAALVLAEGLHRSRSDRQRQQLLETATRLNLPTSDDVPAS